MVGDGERDRPTGPGVIADFVRRLPTSPGVYRMIDRHGEVLYVGKARNLKKRVQSYARFGGQSDRIARMIAATADMEFVSTGTETEALLLEANLIKRHRPPFNVLMRDDKSFPFILIARDHPSAQLVKHRGARRRPGDYFGPFASPGAVNRTLNALQRAFLLRSCSDSVFESRTRPCLLFQIKRCSGPCTGEIDAESYDRLVQEAKAFLSGRSKAIQADLVGRMERAAAALDYETAAIYRDRLAALSHVQSSQGAHPRTVEEADVFACHQDGGQTAIQVFFFRTGQNWGNRAYFPRADRTLEAGEILESFIAQFYDTNPPPGLVLVSHDPPRSKLLADALSTRAGRRITLAAPKRGEKRELVAHALANARESLARRLAESASQAKLLEQLGETLGLDDAPRRIEVYDNSHISGEAAVGAMIVAGAEGFARNQYRTFNIRSADLTPGDDYAMMREVLSRRFTRLIKETGDRGKPGGGDASPWPDLLIIDGGAGQLAAARGVLADLGVESVPVIAVAKGPDRDAGRETFHLVGRPQFQLPARDPVLYFVQRLRDEAHRFAVGAHRTRRRKTATASPLDEIPGIGPARKRSLLRHFGSAKAVSRAALTELEAAPGISAQMARQIHDHFGSRT